MRVHYNILGGSLANHRWWWYLLIDEEVWLGQVERVILLQLLEEGLLVLSELEESPSAMTCEHQLHNVLSGFHHIVSQERDAFHS